MSVVVQADAVTQGVTSFLKTTGAAHVTTHQKSQAQISRHFSARQMRINVKKKAHGPGPLVILQLLRETSDQQCSRQGQRTTRISSSSHHPNPKPRCCPRASLFGKKAEPFLSKSISTTAPETIHVTDSFRPQGLRLFCFYDILFCKENSQFWQMKSENKFHPPSPCVISLTLRYRKY